MKPSFHSSFSRTSTIANGREPLAPAARRTSSGWMSGTCLRASASRSLLVLIMSPGLELRIVSGEPCFSTSDPVLRPLGRRILRHWDDGPPGTVLLVEEDHRHRLVAI